MLSPDDSLRLSNLLRAAARDSAAPLPDPVHLRRLVDTVFWASLEREEGQPARFSICYAPIRPTKPHHTLTFAAPTPLTSNEIVKLSPAMRRGCNAMAAEANEDGDLQLWGIIPLPFDGLCVSAIDPGHIVVGYGGRNRLVCRSGRASFLRNDATDNLVLIVMQLTGQEASPTFENLLAAQSLQRIVDTMVRTGHGGTLLWIPAGTPWTTSAKSARYRLDPPNSDIGDALSAVATTRTPLPHAAHDHRTGTLRNELTATLAGTSPLLDAIGQLTSVDGATVLTEDMRLLAFGVMLRSADAEDDPDVEVIDVGSDGDDGCSPAVRTLKLSRLGGARHRSAAEFCMTHRQSLAFVASQDGTMTIFGWRDSRATLFAVRRAELESL